MIATVIAGGSSSKRAKKVEELCESLHINQSDKHVVNAIDGKSKGEKIFSGIRLVRSLREIALLKPIAGSYTALIILDAHVLSHPAQNALLKLLEEPPSRLAIFLTVTQKHLLLPTILSRCNVITISLEDAPKKEAVPLESILDTSVGQRLFIAQRIISENPIDGLTNLVTFLHQKLLENIKSGNLKDLKPIADVLFSCEKTRIILLLSSANPIALVEQSLLPHLQDEALKRK